MTMQTRPAPVNNDVAKDPRIDSPEVQVIYPTPESPVSEPEIIPTQQTQQERPEAAKPEEKKPEEHTCKVDLQQAIKQNLVAFVLLMLVALGIGYMIGKK